MADNMRVESLTNCYISAPALAELFGVSPDMVRRYVNDYGMPRVSNGKYLLGVCVQWYINRLRMAVAGGDSNDVAQEKLKLIRAQRHRYEIENKKKRGELIDHNTVAGVLNNMGTIVASQLDGMAPRLSSIVAGMDDPGEVQQVLFNECRTIRDNTAAATLDLAATYDDGQYHTTATGTGRGQVGG